MVLNQGLVVKPLCDVTEKSHIELSHEVKGSVVWQSLQMHVSPLVAMQSGH